MPALTKDRNTQQLVGDKRRGGVAAATKIFAGAMLMRNAAGYLTEGATAVSHVGVGRAEQQVDNAAGAAGDADVEYRVGVFKFANSADADEITIADIGKVAYAVDDQTVAKTDGTTTRSPAGFIEGLDDTGVWVRFDEALLRAYLG